MDTKALKVRIKINGQGQAVYPDFQSLAAVGNENWSRYVDREGLGWFYDKTSGHDDDDVESPRGTQFGVLVVHPDFADEAAATFPDDCELIDETELETFYETKVTQDELPDELDEQLLKNLKNELDLLNSLSPAARFPSDNELVSTRITAIESQVLVILDPNGPAPGVRKNNRKRWVDHKAKKGVVVQPPAALVAQAKVEVKAAPVTKAKRKAK